MGQMISSIFENWCPRNNEKPAPHVPDAKSEDPQVTPKSSDARSGSGSSFPLLPTPPTSRRVPDDPGVTQLSGTTLPSVPTRKDGKQLLLFAARRVSNTQEDPTIVLIGPKTGEMLTMDEQLLEEHHGIALGDFLTAMLDPDGRLHSIEKTTAICNAHVKVIENTAVVFNAHTTLVNTHGRSVFTSKHYADAVSQEQLEDGCYYVNIRMLDDPVKLPDGTILHLEGVNPKRTPGPGNKNGKGKKKKKKETVEGSDAQPEVVIFGAGFGEHESREKEQIVGAGFPTHKEPETNTSEMIFGAGFGEHKGPEPDQGGSQANVQIFGAGFPSYREPEPETIFGAGFG